MKFVMALVKKMLTAAAVVLLFGCAVAVVVSPACSTTTCNANMDGQNTKPNNWQCICLNSTDELKEVLDCRCEGLSLNRVPQKLHAGLHKLTLFNCGLRMLRRRGLQPYSATLMDIIITDMPYFEHIEAGAFSNITSLRTIYISHAPELHNISRQAFHGVSRTLKSLRIMYTGLDHIPDMSLLHGDNILHIIDFEGNQIRRIETEAFRVIVEQLILDHNPISWVGDRAFSGSQIGKLSFIGNKEIRQLQPKTFHGIVQIRELDLSYTSLEALPPDGLEGLEVLRIENTPTLKVIPSIYHLKSLRAAHLTYAFHCCAFQFPARHDPVLYAQRVAYVEKMHKICEGVEIPPDPTGNSDNASSLTRKWRAMARDKRSIIHFDSSRSGFGNTTLTKHMDYHSTGQFAYPKEHDDVQEQGNRMHFNKIDLMNEKSGAKYGETGNVWSMESRSSETGADSGMDFGVFHEMTTEIGVVGLCGNLTEISPPVHCKPKADALNPCEDVMGSSWLRVSVWLVVLITILGNIAVLFVSLCGAGEQSVSRFLMVHLALADLCMGLYLLLLASIDAHSKGEFFNYASDWQHGAGCKIAGFLTVFAAQLSIYSLALLTLERWMAITRAIYLERRLDSRMAYRAMAFGWIFSLCTAILPLVGINNYSSTSICLPMSTTETADTVYIIVLLVINALGFVLVALCYIQIYTSLGGGDNGARSEMHVAKKIALLVFIDFVCWAPIAFFALTAIAGIPLIDVSHSKILLVFFYPLNSCANPFLYAILTKQYRRDFVLILIRHGLYKKKNRNCRTTFSLQTTNNSNNGQPIPLITRNNMSHKTSDVPMQEESLL